MLQRDFFFKSSKCGLAHLCMMPSNLYSQSTHLFSQRTHAPVIFLPVFYMSLPQKDISSQKQAISPSLSHCRMTY